MPNTEKGKKYLPDFPEIKIPAELAISRFGAVVADLMEKKDASVAAQAKKMAAREFSWTLAYDQAKDPEDISDAEEFLGYLIAKSRVYLVARGGHWKGWQELDVLPPQVRAKFEDRARLVCAQRAHWARHQDGEPEEPDGFNAGTSADIMDQLDTWLVDNPRADRRLAAVARLALEKLFERE